MVFDDSRSEKQRVEKDAQQESRDMYSVIALVASFAILCSSELVHFCDTLLELLVLALFV